MTTTPHWHATDEQTASLLDLLADDGSMSADYEWDLFVKALGAVRMRGAGGPLFNAINPNDLRVEIAGRIKPQRVGAFTHRALSQGLVEYTGRYVTSTDTKGRNSGKPCRELRWIGGAS